jgi:hypothetical protein
VQVGDIVRLRRGWHVPGEIGVVVYSGLGNRAYVSFPSVPQYRTYAKEALEIVSESR